MPPRPPSLPLVLLTYIPQVVKPGTWSYTVSYDGGKPVTGVKIAGQSGELDPRKLNQDVRVSGGCSVGEGGGDLQGVVGWGREGGGGSQGSSTQGAERASLGWLVATGCTAVVLFQHQPPVCGCLCLSEKAGQGGGLHI